MAEAARPAGGLIVTLRITLPGDFPSFQGRVAHMLQGHAAELLADDAHDPAGEIEYVGAGTLSWSVEPIPV